MRPAQREREGPDGQHGGQRRRDRPHRPPAPVRPAAPRHPQHQVGGEGQQRTPHQVELLLHGERPEVQQRALVPPGGQVVGLLGDEAPVADRERRREHVVLQVGPPQRHRQPGTEQCHRAEHDRGRGQQPAGPAGEELAEPDPAGGGGLAQQQAGDQVAGDDEEDVDPDEAAGQPGDGGVEGEHGEHGQRAQALDVGTEPGRPVRPARGIGTPGESAAEAAAATGVTGATAGGPLARDGEGIRRELGHKGRRFRQ